MVHPPQQDQSIAALSSTRVQAPAHASKREVRRYREVGDLRLLGQSLAILYLDRRQELARLFNEDRDTGLMSVPVNNRAARRHLVKREPRIRGLAMIARYVDIGAEELLAALRHEAWELLSWTPAVRRWRGRRYDRGVGP